MRSHPSIFGLAGSLVLATAGWAAAQDKVEKPVFEKPKIVVEKPAVEKPRIEKVERPVVEKPKFEKPAVDKPRIEKVEKPSVEKTRFEKAEKPKLDKPKIETAEKPSKVKDKQPDADGKGQGAGIRVESRSESEFGPVGGKGGNGQSAGIRVDSRTNTEFGPVGQPGGATGGGIATSGGASIGANGIGRGDLGNGPVAVGVIGVNPVTASPGTALDRVRDRTEDMAAVRDAIAAARAAMPPRDWNPFKEGNQDGPLGRERRAAPSTTPGSSYDPNAVGRDRSGWVRGDGPAETGLPSGPEWSPSPADPEAAESNSSSTDDQGNMVLTTKQVDRNGNVVVTASTWQPDRVVTTTQHSDATNPSHNYSEILVDNTVSTESSLFDDRGRHVFTVHHDEITGRTRRETGPGWRDWNRRSDSRRRNCGPDGCPTDPVKVAEQWRAMGLRPPPAIERAAERRRLAGDQNRVRPAEDARNTAGDPVSVSVDRRDVTGQGWQRQGGGSGRGPGEIGPGARPPPGN